MKDFFKNFTITKAIIIFCVLGVFVMGFFIYRNETSFDRMSTENQAKIKELEQTLSKLNEDPEVTSEVITSTLYSASDVGNKVADLQNEYKSILGTLTESDDYTKNADKIRPYFKDVLDSHMAWFPTNQDYKWVFGTTYSVTNKDIDTVFLCYKDSEKKDILYAYALAKYDAIEGKFVSLDIHQTEFGETVLNQDVTPADTSIVIEENESPVDASGSED